MAPTRTHNRGCISVEAEIVEWWYRAQSIMFWSFVADLKDYGSVNDKSRRVQSKLCLKEFTFNCCDVTSSGYTSVMGTTSDATNAVKGRANWLAVTPSGAQKFSI